MQGFFRIVAFTEGISYLLLLLVSDPLKYWGRTDDLVSPLGMSHGLLFISYLILAFLIKDDEHWKSKDFGIILLASILPFGTFYIDRKYLKNR